MSGIPLHPAAALGRAAPRAPALSRLIGPALVAAATCFNLALCFVNTQGWARIGSLPVVAVSILIVGAGLLSVRRAIGPELARAALLVATATLGLWLLNPGVDLKILFDLLIAPVFFLLGRRSTVAEADRLLLLLVALVLGVGFGELLLPELFQRLFDILDFYTSKGVVAADALNYGGTRFFASAERADAAGRTLLPQLFGPHRVSSLFLEPVSMGNFALIALAWLLSLRRRWSALPVALLFGALLCAVLADSRQAAATILLMLPLRFGPLRPTGAPAAVLAAVLPVLVLLALLVAGTLTLGAAEASSGGIAIASDDVRGRLLFSGQLLASWGWAEWLALAPSELYTADTGYAYIINNVGLPLAAFAWLRGITRPVRSPAAATMRGLVSLYVATSLCVGASLFSIKTAALLWFLFGAAGNGSPARSAVP